jgi:hypothetical protein
VFLDLIVKRADIERPVDRRAVDEYEFAQPLQLADCILRTCRSPEGVIVAGRLNGTYLRLSWPIGIRNSGCHWFICGSTSLIKVE